MSNSILYSAIDPSQDLQQTPASSPKVMLRVFAQPPGATESITHVFTFTSGTNARLEADAIKDALSRAVQAVKLAVGLHSVSNGTSSSAAMAVASAVTSKSGAEEDAFWLHDDRLKSDVALQQSLLKSKPPLSKTFMESLRTKPDTISNSQFALQFWSSRLHLLRAYALESHQRRGAYNVLSTIKPRTEDNTTKLSISKEQIQLILGQHPLVKRVYDENVPKLSEEIFWSRFFMSRLFKKLKGERLTEADSTDPVLDKYLSFEDDADRNQRLLASHVPHIIDVEGNEENHSQRKGNRPDWTMRPTSLDRVPIIRTLNSLSEKIISHVAPSDIDPSAPIGMDEETFNSLALQDLRADSAENNIILNIRDQSRFFSSKQDDPRIDEYDNRDPEIALRVVYDDLRGMGEEEMLGDAIGVDNNSDSEAEEPISHVGSKASLRAASAQVHATIAQQNTLSGSVSSDISDDILERLTLTHATTTEFLHHFWIAFLSGDPMRAGEIAQLLETLDRAMDRIRAVAQDAEVERGRNIQSLKQQIRDHYERTHKKLAFDSESVRGGSKVVNQLMGPTVEAIRIATARYQEAFRVVCLANDELPVYKPTDLNTASQT